jgi:hypothetical protein
MMLQQAAGQLGFPDGVLNKHAEPSIATERRIGSVLMARCLAAAG